MIPKKEDQLVELIAILCAALIIIGIVFLISIW